MGRCWPLCRSMSKIYDSNWEPEVAKLPVVISFPGTELKSRDVVVGLKIDTASRAYPWDKLVKQSPVMDRVNGRPLLIAVGPDSKSFRVFESRIDGNDAEFFLKGDADGSAPSTPGAVAQSVPAANASSQSKEASPPSRPLLLLNLGYCSIAPRRANGTSKAAPSPDHPKGKCLARVPALKDYWFDWRNYHPDTTIYKR